MLSLFIEIQSLKLDENIINANDSLRISVTTIPGGQKQAITFDANRLRTVNPSFSVKINDKLERVLIVLRKKSFSERNPIIASTTIHKARIPTELNNIANTELKTFDFLEPIQHNGQKNTKPAQNRKAIGKFDVQFSLEEDIPQNVSFFTQMNKKKNGSEYSNLLYNNDNSLISLEQIAY